MRASPARIIHFRDAREGLTLSLPAILYALPPGATLPYICRCRRLDLRAKRPVNRRRAGPELIDAPIKTGSSAFDDILARR